MSLPATPLAGLRVAAFEARMSGPMAALIARHGGAPVEAPALREVPLGDHPEVLAFADGLLNGEFDAVVFLTGIGARYLLEQVESRIPRDEFLAALGRTKIIVRGPKPLAVMRDWKVPVAVQVPEPNTWREILSIVDDRLMVAGLRIAIQEYGKPNLELVEGLRRRGATVTGVPVYRWTVPEDTEPLRDAIHEMVAGRIDAALFTSARQVEHVLQVARTEGLEARLRAAMRCRVVVGSVGPTTSEALRDHELPVDVEPEHPKMGHLVAALAASWNDLAKPGPIPAEPAEAPASGPSKTASSKQPVDLLSDSLFMRACRREPTGVTPIWLMRQAGRYMPEYRAVRNKVSFLELCKDPDLATEVTVTAAETLGVDAAILFADILLVLEPLGFDLEFAKGEGPLIHNPVRAVADVDRVRPLDDPAPLDYVFQTVRSIRSALRPDLPLIGFAGAPFTLACYAIEGGGSRHYDTAKTFMFTDPGAWNTLMARLVDATAVYLNAQADAGAQALQLFDSWVGNLSPTDYRAFVLPHMQRLFSRLKPGVPTIHFGTGTGSLLELQRDAGGDVIGLDWRTELDRAWQRLGPGVGVQGNLDPVLLFAPVAEVHRQARRILDEAEGRPGHIFNLGHGVLPRTPVDRVRALVDFVHDAPRSESSGRRSRFGSR